jgi:hypothetical protein
LAEATSFTKICEILADLWMNHRGEGDFKDFFDYNDLGLPMAYAIANGIVDATPMGKSFIEETWDLFLAGLEIKEDTGFDSLDDVLGIV